MCQTEINQPNKTINKECSGKEYTKNQQGWCGFDEKCDSGLYGWQRRKQGDEPSVFNNETAWFV